MGRIPDDKFRIFVSHKHADAALANAVQEAIEGLSEDVFDCWVSGQDIASGSDWSRAILKALAQSHLLILLYTVPQREWDWCLYETGLFIHFANAAEEDVRSVVTIFDPQAGAPRPLAGVQGVPAEQGALAKFLTRLCTAPWEISDDWRRGPLLPKADKAKIEAAAQRVADSFQDSIAAGLDPKSDVRYPCHRVVLDADLGKDALDKIPEDATVIVGDNATTSFTLSLFGLAVGDEQHSWSDLLASLGAASAPWRMEVDAAYAATHREALFVPGNSVIQAWDRSSETGRVYRPVLYSVARREAGAGAQRVQIVIVLDPLPADSLTV